MQTIYLILNKINGKGYVGRTSKTAVERWKTHVYNAVWGSSFVLHKAIRKYGEKNFSIIELLTLEEVDAANVAEKTIISALGTYCKERGYNSTFGGDGVVPTEELRRKQSDSAKKRAARQRELHPPRQKHSRGRRRPEVSTEALVALYKANMSTTAIAKQVGMKSNAVFQRLKRKGFVLRSPKEALLLHHESKGVRNRKQDVIEKYKEGLSYRKVASVLGLPDHWVRACLQEDKLWRNKRRRFSECGDA